MVQQRYILRRSSPAAHSAREVGEVLTAGDNVRILDEGPDHLLVTVMDREEMGRSQVLDGWAIVPERRYERPDQPTLPRYRPGAVSRRG